MTDLRAVVVDDSQFMRTVISDILEDSGIDVVAKASDGEKGVESVTSEKPDVVTMDVQMPRMGGIEAVEKIMEEEPTPVLMLSAYTEEGADATFEALDKGAVDFLQKPGGEVSMDIQDLRDSLVEKVRTVAEADVGRQTQKTTSRSTSTSTSTSATASQRRPETREEYVDSPTVVIGASTGGPSVLEDVVSHLPVEAEMRLLIVQHMPDEFTRRFAERLDSVTEYSIREAQDGDRIGGGEGLVAKGDYHMEVSGYSGGRLRVRLNQEPKIHGVRPAIDVTMETASDRISDRLVGVVLTGMGKDGAEGIRSIKEAGGHTIAQDEETSKVFGIPARAIETGCVDDVLPIDEVAQGIRRRITTDR
ncbi:MAG: chemotaxis response regulator protein-glutamate methylesterase [Halobacteria archaeon]|nr:chemotaxis response regulator protein-glutamate methylesterase [Halobacteria archaeon]